MAGGHLSRRRFLELSSLAGAVPIFDAKLPRGLDFTLQNSPTPEKYLIETMPGGVALLDYNNDGLLDIFPVNGGRVTPSMPWPERFNRDDPRYWNRLYRQNKDGSFYGRDRSGRPGPRERRELRDGAWRSAITTTMVILISS